MKHLKHALRAVPVTLLAAALALTGCFQSEPETSRDDGQIRLSGRVVSTGNAPVAGVVVSLARNGVTDTTDALGRFHLSKAVAAAGEDVLVLDTLRYSKGGLSLARVSVTQWIDTLPDVQVIQRDISGLLTGVSGITRVEAVVTGDGIDSAEPVVTEFYYNALTGNYSGFVFFPPATSVQNYQVVINIYGSGDVLAGQSQVVPFNSFAGNITVPEFAAGNSVPVPDAGADTAVALGATVQLNGTATDALGTITKWEWSIDGGAFAETSSGDTSFTRSTHGAYACILRVTDDDGNTALDTVIASFVSHGTEWTTRTSGVTGSIASVVWTGTQFVAVGNLGVAVTSPDGITWTTQVVDSTATNLSLDRVVWTGQKHIATSMNGSSGAPLYYISSDGITWSTGELPWIVRGPGGMLHVSTADSTVLIGDRNNQFIARSEDHGSTWLVDTLPQTTHAWDGPISGFIAYTKHAGRIVGVGSNGMTVSSAGNSIWTRHTNSGSFPRPHGGVYDYTMTSVTSTGTHAVAVGYAGHVMRSTDGMDWQTPRIVGGIPPEQEGGSSLGDLHGVTWTGSTLVAVGNGFTVLSADGGANWATVQTETGYMRGIAWNGTRLVAVGNGGKIISSP